MRYARSALSSALLCTIGCQQNPTFVSPPTFERPGDIAFACFDSVGREFVTDDNCMNDPAELRYALTVLVTQTARGEVGAVDLRLNQTLDADVRVPGFTFVRVGETPSGIVVPDTNPGVTYVSNFGSRTVQWVETASFRPDARVLSGAGAGIVALPDGPSDIALASAADALFVSLPRLGGIAVVPVLPSGALDDAPPVVVPLESPVPTSFTIGEATASTFTCMVEGDIRTPTVAASDPISLASTDDGAPAEPVSLLVDGDILFVADSVQPLIHRFRIGAGGTLTQLEPLSPGVPVRRLAISPAVPETVGEMSIETRFLYAIDAVDQSVLVMDYGESSPTFGSVLPVRIGDGRGDRIRLSADALSLGILTPGFPGEVCDPTTRSGDESPTRLRGVFLAVGLTNGTFVVVDVEDLDAPCRGASDACGGNVEQDEIVAISRHRVRIGNFVQQPITLTAAPALSFLGSPGTLDEAGEAISQSDPRLRDLGECPMFMDPVWGLEGAPVICASSDPWLSRNERWEASWEAVRPNATGGLGRFDGDIRTITADDGLFCQRGVIGGDDIAASGLGFDDPELGYEGDLFVITSEPPASRIEENDACSVFAEDVEFERVEPVFRVVSAASDRLEVSFDGLRGDPELIFACYGDSFFQYEVRVREAYLVEGSATGVEHRIVSTDGGCRVDTLGQPILPGDVTTIRSSFARSGVIYMNPHVAFSIDDQGRVPDRNSELRFGLIGSPADLVADVGQRGQGGLRRPALVESIVYNPANERLYALDSNSDALLEFSLSPLQAEQVFE